MTALLSRVFGPWVGRVDKLTLRADLVAGILGALLVLPQGFAFATLAGLPPEYGLYTAIVPCVIAALFGFGGIAAGAAGIAKLLFVLFAILAVASFLFGLIKKN